MLGRVPADGLTSRKFCNWPADGRAPVAGRVPATGCEVRGCVTLGRETLGAETLGRETLGADGRLTGAEGRLTDGERLTEGLGRL